MFPELWLFRADILPGYPGKISGSRIFIVYSPPPSTYCFSGIYITSRTLNPEYLPFTGSISGPIIVFRDIPAFPGNMVRSIYGVLGHFFLSRGHFSVNIRFSGVFIPFPGIFPGKYTVSRAILLFPGKI